MSGVLSSAEDAAYLQLFEAAPKNSAKPAPPPKKKATAVEKAQTKETLKIAKLPPHEHTPVKFNDIGLGSHPKLASINGTDPAVLDLYKSVSKAWGVVRSVSYNTAARVVKGLHTIAFGYDHASKTPLVTLRFKEGKLPKAVPKSLLHASFKVVMTEKKNNLKFLSEATPVPVPAAPKLSPLLPVNATASKPKAKKEKRVPLLTIGDQVDRKRKKKVLGEKTLRKHGSSVGACLQGFTKSKKRGDYFLSSWHGVKKLNKMVTNEFGNKVGVISAVNPKGYRRESDMDVVFMHKKDRCKCTKKVPGYQVFKNRASFAAAVILLAKSDAMKRVHLTSQGAGHRRTRKGWINPKRIFESSVVEYPEDKPLKQKKYRVRKVSKNKRKGKKKKGKKAAKKKGKKNDKKKGKKSDKKKGKKAAKKKGKKSEKKKGKKAAKKKGKKKDAKKKDAKKKGKKAAKKKDGKKKDKKKGKKAAKKKGKKAAKKKGKKKGKKAAKKKGKKAAKKKGKKKGKKKADKKKKKTKPRRLRFRGFMRVQYPEEQQPVERDSAGPLYFHDILVGFASSGDDEGANFSPIWSVNDVLPSHLKNRFC